MKSRPPLFTVVLAFLSANGAVVSFALGHRDAQWILWLSLFLVMELTAAVSREVGDTLSERVWCWIGYRPRRRARWIRVPIVGQFLIVLAGHMVTNGAYALTSGAAVAITAAPFGVVIAFAIFKDRR